MKNPNNISFFVGTIFSALAILLYLYIDILFIEEIFIGIFAALSLSAFIYSPSEEQRGWNKLLNPEYITEKEFVLVTIWDHSEKLAIRGILADYDLEDNMLSQIILTETMVMSVSERQEKLNYETEAYWRPLSDIRDKYYVMNFERGSHIPDIAISYISQDKGVNINR